MAQFKYFNGSRELLAIHALSNKDFAEKFPGVKGRRYDGFSMKVGITRDGNQLLPVEREIEYKSHPSRHDCDARCMNAQGKIMRCECSCGGKNHGLGRFVSSGPGL
jgi:hypothetical protein